jgi:hypothetical protein
MVYQITNVGALDSLDTAVADSSAERNGVIVRQYQIEAIERFQEIGDPVPGGVRGDGLANYGAGVF